MAVEKCRQLLIFYAMLLKQLLSGHISFSSLLGPLGLFNLSTQAYQQGFSTFFYFIASFSLTVALINILPVPGLDGGSLLYLLIEKIRGQPLSVALEILLYRLAMIAFSLILIQLLLNDAARLFEK